MEKARLLDQRLRFCIFGFEIENRDVDYVDSIPEVAKEDTGAT